jgi:uncharacterized iron-regulated protein
MKGADFTGKYGTLCAVKALPAIVVLFLAGCAHLQPDGHALAGRIWDARAATFVSAEQLFARSARAQHVILGETHDNAEHHRLQRRVLEALAARGGPRLLAMEQFDSEHQAAIDAAQAKGADAEALADAGKFDRKGWNWPLYRPLVQFAVERGWPLAAANLSRTEARRIVTDPAASGLPPPPAAVKSAIERDIIDGHCGAAPEPKRLAGMVEAQRGRDARMASVLKGRSVLIAGSGHARRDRGVPLYVADGDLVAIAFVEVQAGKTSAQDYLDGSFDYLWFTAPAAREDPCS